jgi:hypothetical protein
MSLKIKIISVLGVLVLSVGVGTGLWYYNGKKAMKAAALYPYGNMNGYVPQKAAVLSLVKTSTGFNENQAAKLFLQDELYKRMASRLKASVSTVAVLAQAKKNYGNQPINAYSYAFLVTETAMNKAAVATVLTSGESGRYIIYHFNQHMTVEGAPIDNSVAPLSPRQQDALVASDKAYAFQLATKRRDALENKTTTFAQTMLDEKADPRLGLIAIPTLRHSSTFDTATETPDDIYSFRVQKQLVDVLKHTKKDAITPVLVGQSPAQVGDHPRYVDAYYVIFSVDSANQTAIFGTASDFESSSKKEYNYKEPTI